MNYFSIQQGIPEHHRNAAARVFWGAFQDKLGAVLGPDRKALTFLSRCLELDCAIWARDDSDRFLGMAGFKTPAGAFVGGGLEELQADYGTWGGLWRGGLLGMLERKVEPGVLLMDGICVSEEARGRGIGTALLRAIRTEAGRRGLREVRLDVIDGNKGAADLYKREGFSEERRTTLGPLALVFGFRGATEMRLAV